MQACVDESGEKGQDDWLTLVGLITSAEQWASFADRWQGVLNEVPAVSAWHMHDAAKLQGEFLGWSADQRDERLRHLAEVVNEYDIAALHCSVDIPAYMELMAPLVDLPFEIRRKQGSTRRVMNKHPYWIGFQAIIMAVCYELIDQGVTERFEIMFDEKKILGPRVRAWYPALRIWMEPHEDAIMPVDPGFTSDVDFVPLQCSDLLAWILHRDLIDGDGDPMMLSPRKGGNLSHSFGWVKNAMNGLTWSGHRQLFDRQRLQGIRQQAIDQGISAEKAARMDELAPR